MASRKRKQNVVPSDCGVVKRPRLDFSHNEDVIGEILSWLPTKSLLRFRCVCKSWKDLISRSSFVNKHLSRGPAVSRLQILQRDYNDIELDLKTNTRLDVRCSTDIFSLNSDKSPAIVGSCNGFSLNSDKSLAIVGSCNGLICLRVSKKRGLFLLWNPCTGETKMLPELTSFSKFEYYGFGYDFSTKDYKVIVGGGTGLFATKVAVLTLKTGSWRIVEGLDFVSLRKDGCLLDGSLHWLMYERDNEDEPTIVSFDLEEEEFEAVVPLPPTGYPNPKGIGSTGTNLFVFCYKVCWADEVTPLTIWTKEGDSWSKLEIPCVAQCQHGIISVGSISILEKGEVLILPRNKRARADPLLYIPELQEFRYPLTTKGVHRFQSVTCLETLISPEAVFPGSSELVDAANRSGDAIHTKKETHRMAETDGAFAYFP